MKPPYRVQKYIMDMGVYHKHSIIDGVSHPDYIKKNVYQISFYVILPSDDIFGEKLPQVIGSYQDRAKICRKYENMC